MTIASPPLTEACISSVFSAPRRLCGYYAVSFSSSPRPGNPAAARYTAVMDQFDHVFEQFKVHGKDLADKIRDLIHEGNVRRIIIKDENGHTFLEIPLTVATIGVVAAPILAAVGAIAALVSKCDVVVERTPDGK
jgi:hypothetical protein